MSANDETTIREAQSSNSAQLDENSTPMDTPSTPPVRQPTGPQPTDNVEPH